MNTTSNFALAACDLDGTLLEGSALSARNREAVDLMRQRGIRVVLATGRNFHHAVNYHRDLGLDGPIVSNDGALVSIPDGEILLERHLPQDATAKILALAAERKVTCLAFHRNGIVLVTKFDFPESLDRHHEMNSRFRRGGVQATTRKQVYKTLLYSSEPANIDAIEGLLRESFGDQIDIIRNNAQGVEFVAKGVNKVSGLEAVCRHYGIEPSVALAFGDGVNDIGMFRWAGLSVCMNHGHQQAKEAAKLVAPESAAAENFAHAVDAALQAHPVATRP